MHYVEVNVASEAYRRAGGKGDPSGNAPKLLAMPYVQKCLEEHRAVMRQKTGYSLEKAMSRAQEAADFAKETKNANAFVKAVELESKLNGLLIEKHQHQMLGHFQLKIEGIDDVKPQALKPIEALPPGEIPAEAEFKDFVIDETAEKLLPAVLEHAIFS